jgi:nucleoside-diphosphate-sugar epimerase
LDAAIQTGCLKRFVNVSSFIVYSGAEASWGSLLDEGSPTEKDPVGRHDAYGFGKLRQEEIVAVYARRYGLSCVTLRPGVVFGPGKKAIPGLVGLDTFGLFLHLGGSNPVPLTYVDNCAEAIVLAGLADGVAGEIFNVVDDDLPTSREFLRQYKREVRRFRSLTLPYWLTRILSCAWSKYSDWSKGQLPPVFNSSMCAYAWKKRQFSNDKLKQRLGWRCTVPMHVALDRYFAYQRLA